jgi:hypothetical protein
MSNSFPQSGGPARDLRRYDLTRFTLGDMVRCGSALRLLASNSTSVEEGAHKVVQHLYDNLRNKTGDQRSCLLVRLFKTQRYAELPQDLRNWAASRFTSGPLSPESTCLTLLATAGDEPQWNSRRTSAMHQCVPLLSERIIEAFPMISQLIQQLGMKTSEIVRMTPAIIKELSAKSFGVFYVPVAKDSPSIPAQSDFVTRYGVRSVLGFGGVSTDGGLFVLIMFARVAIPACTAEMFRTVALNLKLGFLAIVDKPVFAD